MTNLIRNHLRFIAVLAISSNFCLAQSSLPFSFVFTNTTPLIDMNGVFQVSDVIIGGGGVPVALNYGVGLSHDSRGVLRSSGTTLVQIGDDFQAAFVRANGRVSGGGDNPVQVFLSVNLNGDGTVAGVDTHFSISVAYLLTFNPVTASLEGSSRGKMALSRVGVSRIASDNISVGVPSGGDGSWTMNGTVVPLTRMLGSAQILLSSANPSGGRGVNGLVLGNFDPTGVSGARFVGTNVDRGSAGTFSFSTTETGGVVLETIQARILGQRVLQ
jgi:hypothetical protein